MQHPLDNLPAAMRTLDQWLVWRFETYPGDKKPRKVPYYVNGRKRRGEQGSAEDRQQLASFAQARTLVDTGRFDGLGFAFLPGDGLIGIDIDGAVDLDTGEVAEHCLRIIDQCASYTERSPSGRGVHIIVAGHTQTFKDNSIGVEVFCGRQFFTCTGDRWAGTPKDVASIAEPVLHALHRLVKGQRAVDAKTPQAAQRAVTPDTDDFKRVNTLALQCIDMWVPQLFPSAKRTSYGYRISSRDLGRDLREDLQISIEGVMDFGEERGMSAIDCVMRFAPAMASSSTEAMKWLANQCGIVVGIRRVAYAPANRAQAAPPIQPQDAPDLQDDGTDADDQAEDAPAYSADPEGAEARSTPASGSAPGGRRKPRNNLPPALDALLLRNSEGGVADCRENVFLTLKHHPELTGLVAFDEFAYRVLKTRTTPWGSEPGEWATDDDYSLGYWLATQLRLRVRAEATLAAGVAMAATDNKFHPVRQYLDGLPAWDGIDRLTHWLHECLGAADTTYTRLIGPWFVMNMVRRIRQPGCQADYMIVLEGKQGKRKSTSLRTLVGRDDWFADTPIRIGDKDALLNLAGKWLYEIAELDSFSRAETTAVKQYLTSRIDRVREPFARRPADRPRSCVFAGTTNQDEYSKDSTGARRFWPVACDNEINLDKLAADRDQMFAEAIARLASDDAETRRCWPTREEEQRYLVPEQERREIGDPWFERIASWVDSSARFGDAHTEACDRDSFTTHELLVHCLGVPSDRIDGARQMSTRVGIAMHKLGWTKKRDAHGARLWRYIRPTSKPGQGADDQNAVGGPTSEPQAGGPAEETLDEF
jgi:predicted P-loop ATPase